jgi:hypothetical protein
MIRECGGLCFFTHFFSFSASQFSALFPTKDRQPLSELTILVTIRGAALLDPSFDG